MKSFICWIVALLGFSIAAVGQMPQEAPLTKTTPGWVIRSNQNAQLMIGALAKYAPEYGSFLGVTAVDEHVLDLGPGFQERTRAALREAVAQLRQKLADERDPAVRQDLEIMINSGEDKIRESELDEKYLVPYYDIPQLVFRGIRPLLDEQASPERRKAALVRLRRYAGMEPGYEPITMLAQQRAREGFARPDVKGPFNGQVQKDLGNAPTYIAGIEKLFEKFHIAGYQAVYARIKQQLGAYDEFVRNEILPHARSDFRLAPELYAHHLRVEGIPLRPEEIATIAHAAFDEIQSEMVALAPAVARQKGIRASDYRDVIHELKKDQWEGRDILQNYEKRIAEIENIIRREHLVTLPERPLTIELASEAESAVTPAPHMRPAQLVNNTGQHGIFLLPLRIPAAAGNPGHTLRFDDFTFAAASWTLTAHEGRPGHELQFDSMVEKGTSIARAVFSFNSTNVEGWGLYSEAILKPYMPPDGQLISLQARLQRAARAFLDPELQTDKITPEQAKHVLMDDVVLSDAMATQEVERYTFLWPGQAPTYFYGYTQLMRLRADTEKALGSRFDQQRFHDFVLSQGILPPPMMRKAVFEQFVGAPPR